MVRLPRPLVRPLARALIWALENGHLAPHRYGNISNAAGDLYMERGWLIKPSWWTFGCGARVHKTVRSDTDRHLHDHPWPNVSVILEGGYLEETPALPENPIFLLTADRELVQVFSRQPGDVVVRAADDRHRLVVPEGAHCYSLFLMGPWRQVWGFYPRQGKVEWRTYLGLPPKGDDEQH